MNKNQTKTKLIYGIGINDADYRTSPRVNGERVRCPFYTAWQSMLARCYSAAYKSLRPTYDGVSICKEWLIFSNFKHWMEAQAWSAKALDKDIIKPGNKVYAPDTCVFVTQEVNKLLNMYQNTPSQYPVGVHFVTACAKYKAAMSRNGKLRYLGLFDTPEEAAKVYAKAKAKYIREVARKQKDPRVKKGLRLHAGLLLDSV